MAAADLANDCLEPGAEGGMIPDCARNVVVYHAHDDLALRSSKVANVHNKIVRRRLGHTGPAELTRAPRNVVAVDCDAFNNGRDRLGHSYFLGPRRPARALLRHLVETIRTGRVPGAEAGSRRLMLPGAGLTGHCRLTLLSARPSPPDAACVFHPTPRRRCPTDCRPISEPERAAAYSPMRVARVHPVTCASVSLSPARLCMTKPSRSRACGAWSATERLFPRP